jgi:hypothetical protein
MVLDAPPRRPLPRSRGSRRRTDLVILLAVVALAASALALFLTRHPEKSPVRAAVPTGPASVSVVHGVCRGTDGLGHPGSTDGPVWVDPDPSDVVALWLPGMNVQPCRSVVTRLGAARARELAAAVRSSKAADTSGARNCPADDGASVTMFFTYPHQATAEVARLSLSGCPALTAPGRAGGQLLQRGYTALQPVPAAWGRYFG